MPASVKNSFIHVDLAVDHNPRMRGHSCPPKECDREDHTKRVYEWHGEAWLPKDNMLSSTHSVAHTTSTNATQVSKKWPRPCKGKRLRRKKFVEKMKAEIAAHMDTFDMGEVSWPPSLAHSCKQRQTVIRRLENYQQQVLSAV